MTTTKRTSAKKAAPKKPALPVVSYEDTAKRDALERPAIEHARQVALSVARQLTLALAHPFGPERRAFIRKAYSTSNDIHSALDVNTFKAAEGGEDGIAQFEACVTNEYYKIIEGSKEQKRMEAVFWKIEDAANEYAETAERIAIAKEQQPARATGCWQCSGAKGGGDYDDLCLRHRSIAEAEEAQAECKGIAAHLAKFIASGARDPDALRLARAEYETLAYSLFGAPSVHEIERGESATDTRRAHEPIEIERRNEAVAMHLAERSATEKPEGETVHLAGRT